MEPTKNSVPAQPDPAVKKNEPVAAEAPQQPDPAVVPPPEVAATQPTATTQPTSAVVTEAPAGPDAAATAPAAAAAATAGPVEEFPLRDLEQIEHDLVQSRWSIPIFEKEALDVCLHAYRRFCAGGRAQDPVLQRFEGGSMVTCMDKLLNSPPVSNWKPEVLRSINMHVNTVLETLSLRVGEDCQPVLSALDSIFNQAGTFHTRMAHSSAIRPALATRPADPGLPYGYLHDYVNAFAAFGGFDSVLERSKKPGFTTHLYALYLRPFGNCAKILLPETIVRYLEPLLAAAADHLTQLEGTALQAECNTLAQNECVNPLATAMKVLKLQLQPGLATATAMDQFYLSLILKLLKSNSYNGVMYALNELKHLIDSTRPYNVNSSHPAPERPHETVTAAVLGAWLIDNDIVQLLFKERLHQAQYVSKLEDLLRFLVTEKLLTNEHLDLIWKSQENKHESIVSNIFDLLARLAFTFDTTHLDHLFTCFQASWGGTSRAMERLLEFVQRLAAEDTEGKMANKVLQLLWTMARDTTTTTELMQAALNAHRSILQHIFVKGRETIIQHYVVECIKDVLAEHWVVHALCHMRNLLSLLPAGHANLPQHSFRTRADVIKELQQTYNLQQCILAYLCKYCDLARAKGLPPAELPEAVIVGTVSHHNTLDELFTALRMLACDGHIVMAYADFDTIWRSLVVQPPCSEDRDSFFAWLALLAADCFPLRQVFETLIQLPAHDLTVSMFSCFEHLFTVVNTQTGAITANFFDVQLDKLVGLDRLWAWTFECSEELVTPFFDLLKQVYGEARQAPTTPHNPTLPPLLAESLARLKEAKRLLPLPDQNVAHLTRCIERCLMLIEDVVSRADNAYIYRRILRPHRMSFFGDSLNLVVESQMAARGDVKLEMHGNQPLVQLRQHIAAQCGVQAGVLSLSCDGRVLGLHEDRVPLSALGVTPLSQLSFKLTIDNGPFSPPSSAANMSLEQQLPGAIIAKDANFWETIFALTDEPHAGISGHARTLTMLLPTGQSRLFDASKCVDPAAMAAYCRQQLLEQADCNPFHLQYFMQLVYSMLRPLGGDGPFWRIADFAQAGGLALLDELARPLVAKVIAATADDDFSVGLLRLVLAIIHWVLAQQTPPTAASAPASGEDPATTIIGPAPAPAPVEVAPVAAVVEVHAWQRELASSLFTLVRQASTYDGGNTQRQLLALDAVHCWWQGLVACPPLLVEFTSSMPSLEGLKLVLLSGHVVARDALGALLPTTTDGVLAAQLTATLRSWYLAAMACPVTCSAYFNAFCGLLRAHPLPGTDLVDLVASVCHWLKNLPPTQSCENDSLLGGQLQLLAALLTLRPDQGPAAEGLLLTLLAEFLFSPSTALLRLHQTGELVEPPLSRCQSVAARRAAMAAVVAIAALRQPLLVETLTQIEALHFSDPAQAKEDKTDAPIVVARRHGGPAGLRNAGATCYMNAVLQQLYMQPEIRCGVLKPIEVPEAERADSLLLQVQSMFAHLLRGTAQYYVPEGFWKAYRHWGEPVNVREQQDAREFFDNLVDQVDESLKRLAGERVIAEVCGGVYTDLKKLKGCGHEFERDEVFITLSLSVRHLQSLQASLESHIRPDLVEAYTCETCNEKRECFKSPLFKKLPKALVIQLKRFDYDWERGQAIKFNDQFEFPMTLDMAPYTLDAARAKSRGEAVPLLPYTLMGVIVHSGQANGGHYYSYIRERPACGVTRDSQHWMKFDDNEVSEPVTMDETSMTRDWFGGEYNAQIWDTTTRRYENKRKERCWSAYMLVYEQTAADPGPVPQPEISPIIARDVTVHNIEFRHFQDIYCADYFNFLPQLALECAKIPVDAAMDATSPHVQCLGLALNFMTQHGLHADRVLRSRLDAWAPALAQLFGLSAACRTRFSDFAINAVALRKYLVDPYAVDIKALFAGCLLALLRASLGDPELGTRLDTITIFTVGLLEVETAQVVRQMGPLLRLLVDLSRLSSEVCMRIVSNRLLGAMMPLLHHTPKQPLFDFSLFYAMVSLAITSLQLPNVTPDVAARNPYRHTGPVLPPSDLVAPYLQTTVLTTLMHSTINADIERLCCFLVWSNPHFANELLMAGLRAVEHRQVLDLPKVFHYLGAMLCVEDAHQAERLQVVITASSRGTTVSLFDTIQRCIVDSPRRVYLAMKFVKRLIDRTAAARELMQGLPRYTTYMVDWLRQNLTVQYTNTNYQAYSNEAVAGLHLERSRSAHNLLRALEEQQVYDPGAPVESDGPPEYESDNSEDDVFPGRH